MPVSVPAYGAAYSESEQDTNAATICGYIDTVAAAAAADATDVVSLGTSITALANALEGGGPWQGDFVTRTDLKPLVAILRGIQAAL